MWEKGILIVWCENLQRRWWNMSDHLGERDQISGAVVEQTISRRLGLAPLDVEISKGKVMSITVPANSMLVVGSRIESLNPSARRIPSEDYHFGGDSRISHHHSCHWGKPNLEANTSQSNNYQAHSMFVAGLYTLRAFNVKEQPITIPSIVWACCFERCWLLSLLWWK